MKKLTCIITAVSLIYACSSSPKTNKNVSRLKDKKYTVDSTINAQSLVVYVKVKNKTDLISREEARDQKNIEATYNIFKDKSGKIRYIAELPFSPKDDWFISYKSYFDEDGKLFAFQRENNYFGSECTKGAAMENLVKFYNPDFSIADSVFTLTDTKKTPLDKTTCKFPYNFPYKINSTIEEYKKERGFAEL
ncbi:hypothetical protein [Desertivirga arenae]|uniref:hypothetical protein n=1 Tax=Desertivirga arenae TaxID=2810309 RepID=UPI001A973ECD|nr:hypothetical protein [Pedobacter sp. SYSU D00823]